MLILILMTIFGLGFFEGAENVLASGVLRVHQDNPRYFTDDSGKPIYLAGWNSWGNLQDGFVNAWRYNWGNPFYSGYGEYAGYLNDLQAKNLNYIRLWLYETPRVDYGYDKFGNYLESDYPDLLPWKRTGPGNAADGGLKFDLTRFNDDYFIRLQERISAAQAKGIYVSVMLFEGWSVHNDIYANAADYQAWAYHPFNSNNNINGINGDPDGDGSGDPDFHSKLVSPAVLNLQKAYVEKVVDAVNKFDNVIFEIGNEMIIDPYSTMKAAARAWELEMANHIRSYESATAGYKKHPVGITSNTYIYDTSKVDQDMLGPAVNPNEFLSPMGNCCSSSRYYEDPPSSDGRKIIIAETDHFGTWDIRGGSVPQKPFTQAEVAQQIERAKRWPWKSFTRGLHPSLLRKDPKVATGWDEAVKRMGQTMAYAGKIDLAHMVPIDDSACSSTGYCLANPGKEYLVYQPLSGPFTVYLPAGDYDYEWFNPATAAVSSGAVSVGVSGNQSFNPLAGANISADAVLYIKSGSANTIQKVIRIGDSWNYFKGISTPNASWTGLSFTGSWPDAGPTTIGRGSGYNTTLTGTNYTTFYARKNFTIADSSTVVSMRLYLGYDDGFVAYINGQEVARSANISGTPTHTTITGTSHEVSVIETYDLTSHIAKLQNGNNILAVEIHNKDTSAATDIGISPELEITSIFAPADVDGIGGINIKDIQLCVKVITNAEKDPLIVARCREVADPKDRADIKDIQAIIKAIINP